MTLEDYVRPRIHHGNRNPPKKKHGLKARLLSLLTTEMQSFDDLAVKLNENRRRVHAAARNLQCDRVNLTISKGCVRLRKATFD